jgi:hypothetical protein
VRAYFERVRGICSELIDRLDTGPAAMSLTIDREERDCLHALMAYRFFIGDDLRLERSCFEPTLFFGRLVTAYAAPRAR